MLELENTYLLKELPKGFLEDIKKWTNKVIKWSKEIIDIYIPYDSKHPKIRLRKNGDKYELTKKTPTTEWNASIQKEETIVLSKKEFQTFSKIEWKKVEKIRYYYNYNDSQIAEIDIFTWDLKWLIVIDFEFNNEEEKDKFEKPDFCLADITQDDFIAWWMIAWKKYSDLEEILQWYWYLPKYNIK